MHDRVTLTPGQGSIFFPCLSDGNCKKRGKMKTKVFSCLISILFLSLLTPVYSAESAEKVLFPEIPRISAEDLKKMIDEGRNDFIVVDVRDSGSYDAGHIKGAINIYYDPTSDPMTRQMMLLALDMEKLIITYCDCTDDSNSGTIAEELYKLGFDRKNTKVLAGGSLRWRELKYPMVGKK
jgi:rhodanese-related sulfurtransferase